MHRRLSNPFFPFIMLSALPMLGAWLLTLLLVANDHQPQYVALNLIALLVLLIHGVALRFGCRYQNYTRHIWLVAISLWSATLLLPFFLADYWLFGLYLTVVAPLNIVAVDRMKRLTWAIVISLITGSLVLAIDLLNLTPTLNLPLSPTVSPIAYATSITVLGGIHLIIAGILLWHYRLRPGATRPVQFDLVTQQTLVFGSISMLSVVVVAGVLLLLVRQSQIEQVGQNFQSIAEVSAERVRANLNQQLSALLAFTAQSDTVRWGLHRANAELPADELAARRMFAEDEWLWRTSNDNDRFVLNYRTNSASLALSEFRNTNLLHNNLVLTDMSGRLTAVQGNRPVTFNLSHHPWWQRAWDDGQGGVYIGSLRVNTDQQQASMRIAVGVLDNLTNRIIGVLSSEYDLQSVQNDITRSGSELGGEVFLLNTQGVVLATSRGLAANDRGMQDNADTRISTLLRGRTDTPADWQLTSDTEGEPLVVAIAPVVRSTGARLDPLGDLGWYVVVTDTQRNALARVTTSTQVATMTGLLLLTLIMLLASAAVRAVSRPIETLTEQAAAMAGGNLHARAHLSGPTELMTLAEAFNSMATRLSDLINNLQEQVRGRTEQLETRVNQLGTLNRVTQSIASFTELQPVLQVVAREIADLLGTRSCGIAMLNNPHSELEVIAEYDGFPNHPSAVGVRIPLQNGTPSRRVIDTGKTLVINQPELTNYLRLMNPLVAERGPQSLLIVPLQVRGVTAGTIGITSFEPGRVFTPAEVELIETVAGQVAGAVESARLFEQERQAREQAETLRAATQALTRTLDTRVVFARVLEELRRVVPYDSASVQKLEDGRLYIIDGVGFDDLDRVLTMSFDAHDPITPNHLVLDSRLPIIIDDVNDEYTHFGHVNPQFRTASWMGVPLLFGDQLIGMITLDKREARFYNHQHASLAQAIAVQAATAIANATLFDETRKAREAAEAASVAKSTFLANMSHELRTPLNAILGFAQVMEREPGLSPTQQEYLGIILRSGNHLLGLINDVLELSKIEAGRQEVNAEVFDLWKLLDSVEEMIALRAATKSLVLHVNVATDVPRYISSDQSKLRQILINLLGNAVKFTARGTITLTVQTVPPAASTNGDRDHTPHAPNLRFAVQDTGEGIPHDQQAHLFQAFVQTSSGRKTQEGTGLGLVISRQFVELLGGTISLESEPGVGSTFTFTIAAPIADAPGGSTSEPHATHLHITGITPADYRILVVDDRLENRLLLQHWLQASGFQVREATNGKEALDVWRTWQPHLIWMDIRMPVMDGYEASRQIKQSPQGNDTIVIAVTASAFEHERAAVLAIGCDDFVRKPVLETTFFECMALHLGFEVTYRADGPATDTPPTPIRSSALDRAALRTLPFEWLSGLQEAIVIGDTSTAYAIIRQIEQHHERLANVLQTMVQQYQFDALEAELQEITRTL